MDAIKRQLVNGLPGSPQDYELDHLIPLGLGGHPTSSKNLWLQNWTEAAIKDRDELRLHRDVCAGRITLEEAQHEMVTTWGPRLRRLFPSCLIQAQPAVNLADGQGGRC